MKGKTVYFVLLTCVFLLGQATLSFAEDTLDERYSWSDKLGRGVANVFTSPLEIIRGIDLSSKSDGAVKGWTVGVVKGLAGTILRLGAGVIEFVTFPFDFPDKGKAPIIEPEFVWDDWEGEYMM